MAFKIAEDRLDRCQKEKLDYSKIRVAVFDLDGCTLDDISPQLDDKFGMHKGPLNSALREAVFVLQHALPHSRKFYASLLREGEAVLDINVVNVMKRMQDNGTELHIVTKRKWLDKAWLTEMLGKHGVSIGAERIHIVNGDKADTINKLNADLVIDDQPDSVLNINEGTKIVMLRRSYNRASTETIRLLRGSSIHIVDPNRLASEFEQ